MGLVIFLTGAGTWIKNVIDEPTVVGIGFNVIYKVLEVFRNMVAPASMLVIGARLADIDFKGIFNDKYMYPFVALRLLVLPAIIWLMLRLISFTGLLDQTAFSVLLILASTPAAAVTTMFAELYDGDSPYAGKLVAITTILSVITMPIVAFLLYL
jgi:predicted permease